MPNMLKWQNREICLILSYLIMNYMNHKDFRIRTAKFVKSNLHHWILLLTSFIKLLSSITVNARLPGQNKVNK